MHKTLLVFVIFGILVEASGCVGPCSVPFFLVRKNAQPVPPQAAKQEDEHVELVRPPGIVPSMQNLPITEVK
jgi:hypothetical protein